MRSCLKFPLLGARCVATKNTQSAYEISLYVSTHNIATNEARICLIICAFLFLDLREIIFFYSETAAQELNLLCRTLY